MIITPDDRDDRKPDFFIVAEADYCKDYSIQELINAAYGCPGEHQKSWWIEQIASRLGVLLKSQNERGVAP